MEIQNIHSNLSKPDATGTRVFVRNGQQIANVDFGTKKGAGIDNDPDDSRSGLDRVTLY